MAGQRGRRRFGNVRKLPSGRWQARYVGPDGLERKAPQTFEKESQAVQWLTLVESEIIKREWVPPEAGEILLGEYGPRWISERKLEPRTREGYEDLFRLHIGPHLGRLPLGSIKPQTIRTWRRHLLDAGTSEPQAVKSYALLRAILNTAIKEDGIIRENPCRIKGYDRYHTPERTVAKVPQVYALADVMPARYRALVIFAAFSSLRWGELAALRRCDVDLEEAVVRVPRKLAALRKRLEFGAPKSEAGKRQVSIPMVAVDVLRGHLDEFVASHGEAIVFTGERAALLRSGNFGRAVKWKNSVRRAGLPDGFTFHDLRHTGNHLASTTGASTRELMHRMGHSSMRAALIYQHATRDRDKEIATGMDDRIRRHQRPASDPARVADDDQGDDAAEH
ncbi:tyrosine-type recombinase/integrase [Catellatospora coxensis]|uniref:Putative prophage phiRv2 integrase n=1 Tax=Catellatospora coxensis TaxID=310354 RepID=A0A8J3KZ38_9ACTN|nr:site-specific integrase [Catellatospora coxensis]GIG11393.1 putative prophage phiRv2 integrase [Catellatospora coxensis]